MPLEVITIPVPLVSLETAKQHLRITDDDHDADVQQKLDAAQASIIAKVGTSAVDPTWTETTVPVVIAHAILMLLEALYDREYDGTTDKFERTWRAIDALLAHWRYLVIA